MRSLLRLTLLLLLAAPLAAQQATSSRSPAQAERVKTHPPATAASGGVGRSAFCGDGTFSVGQPVTRSCVGHGGVVQWTDGSLDIPVPPVAKCRDGSDWYNSSRSTACRGHGGVGKWKKKNEQ